VWQVPYNSSFGSQERLVGISSSPLPSRERARVRGHLTVVRAELVEAQPLPGFGKLLDVLFGKVASHLVPGFGNVLLGQINAEAGR